MCIGASEHAKWDCWKLNEKSRGYAISTVVEHDYETPSTWNESTQLNTHPTLSRVTWGTHLRPTE
jgi:hypothetical protein